MRISTIQIFRIADNSIADANRAIVNTQEQIASGRKVLRPSDDPVAATQILSLNQEINNLGQYQRNIDIAKNNVQLEESLLDSIDNIIVRMRELAVQAGNTATLSEGEYEAMAAEVDVRIDELLNLFNSKNSSGAYIFGGYKSESAPFERLSAGGFSYSGDQGQQSIKISEETKVPVSDSGHKLFVDIESSVVRGDTRSNPNNRANPTAVMGPIAVVDQEAFDALFPEDMVLSFNEDSAVAPPGKNFTVTERGSGRVIAANQAFRPGAVIEVAGVSFSITGNPSSAEPGLQGDQFFIETTQKRDVLSSLSDFSHSMKSMNGSEDTREALQNTIAITLENLQYVQNNVLDTVTELGARFNVLESTEELHIESQLYSQELLSALQDTDYAEAATRLSAQTLVLEAAQASFVRVSRLTLFSQL